ncbi:MAG: hypothetical protein RLZ07_535 [Pseudomonadota bacterium]|jgi:hypothetical protein
MPSLCRSHSKVSVLLFAIASLLSVMGRAQADETPIRDAHHCATIAKEAVETRLTEEKVIYSLAGGAVLSLKHKIYFPVAGDKCFVDMQFHIVQNGTTIINRYVTDPETRVIYAALTQSRGKKNPESDEAKFVCNYGRSYDESNTCSNEREFETAVKELTRN